MTDHSCRWLEGIKCWQKGKRIKKSECTPCLIVNMWSSLGWLHWKPSPKKTMKEVTEE